MGVGVACTVALDPQSVSNTLLPSGLAAVRVNERKKETETEGDTERFEACGRSKRESASNKIEPVLMFDNLHDPVLYFFPSLCAKPDSSKPAF